MEWMVMNRAWYWLLAGGVLWAEPRPAPRVLMTAEDLARIEALAQWSPWAAEMRASIVRDTPNWEATQKQRYGLAEWGVPPEGGQWSHWYVCQRHGTRLTLRPPSEHVCGVDSQVFTGYPYDQVIFTRRNSDNAAAIRDNGIAYRLSGKTEFARDAARILLAYADVYQSYPIHDTNGREARSGARAGAQTLDESVWLIPVAWGYDLIQTSGVLTEEQKQHIEKDLLRAAVAVIQRNDAGMSNWQSWHNAAIGAVGFALADEGLIKEAIDGKSGFHFQMRHSVFEDGFWYEGAWGYHFYALEPLFVLAEMAARNGHDLYAEYPLYKMFDAPLRFALPDWTLPNFNDSGNVSILGYGKTYEVAYRRYDKPEFALIPASGSRGREGLYWGADSLPKGEAPQLESAIFPHSGNALLRAPGSDHTIAFKFGPHGGGHGHYDKLNFIYYARGGMMAVDPGTQQYAAPSHNTWDKMTVAHNTVVMDERTQAEATGNLMAFVSSGAMTAVRADAGPAYRNANLERTIYLAPEYAVDVFRTRATDGAEHTFDWLYHNHGKLATTLPLTPFSGLPKVNGYQHLTKTQSGTAAGEWRATFDMNSDLLGNYGSAYINNPAIRWSYTFSQEQAASGRFSGKLAYDFTDAAGYIVFSTPLLRNLPEEAPFTLRMKVYGDGSGNRLALRIYDSTDERFVYSAGPVNWTGWREITASDPAKWTHYLGNADGLFDWPARTVSVELTSVNGATKRSSLYVDDITLEYPSGTVITVADFERQFRALRLWMLGAAGTMVVTGEGLGPDLSTPVPFVMARRRAADTTWVTLLEPYGEAPAITGFRMADDGTLIVTSPQFEDRFSLGAAGELRYGREAKQAYFLRPATLTRIR
jgi:hypothetical protein